MLPGRIMCFLPDKRRDISSGLSVDDFIKKSNIVYLDPQGFAALSEAAMLLAQAESLDAHAHSVRIRL